MKKFLAILALLFCTQAEAQTINNLGAGRGSVLGTDLFPSYQGANPAVRPSAAQIAAYTYGLMSGDATASGVGAVTLATVNANVGSFGSATNCTTITVNAKGLITAASQTACTPAIGSVTGLGTGVATALGVNIGSAGAPVLFNGAGGTPSSLTLTNATGLPLAQLTGAGTGVLAAMANAVNGAGGLITVGNAVTSVSTACGLSGGPITTTGTISGGAPVRANTGTTDTILSSDCGKVVTESNAASVAVTLPQATGSFAAPFYYTQVNLGAGTVTITPTTSTINGAATLVLTTGQSADIVSDGTNYIAALGKGGGSGTVTTTGSPANGNLAQFSGASSITNGNLSGDCTTNGTLAANCNLPNSGIVSNRWYSSLGPTQLTFGGTSTANQIACKFSSVPRLVTVKALAFYNNVAGSTNVQLAIYANDTTTGRPAALIGNTGNIANTGTGAHSGAMAANKQIGPGGADGGREVWFCSNMGDATATYGVPSSTANAQSALIGATNAGEVLVPNDNIAGIICAGAACNGGSSTLGTWPATLAGTTWTNEQPSTSGIYSPIVAYQAN